MLEAKGNYQWLLKTNILSKEEMYTPMMEQLKRQVGAMANNKLEWHFAEEKTMNEFKFFLEGSPEGKALLNKTEFKYTKPEK